MVARPPHTQPGVPHCTAHLQATTAAQVDALASQTAVVSLKPGPKAGARVKTAPPPALTNNAQQDDAPTPTELLAATVAAAANAQNRTKASLPSCRRAQRLVLGALYVDAESAWL